VAHLSDNEPTAKLLAEIVRQNELAQNDARASIAAALAGGLIAASGRPHTIQEALELHRDVRLALYPKAGQGPYLQWAETRAETLAKVRD
jgi:hypothetical protein